MNQSHPRTAARTFGGGGPSGARPVEDLPRGVLADAVDELADLGDAPRCA